MNVSRSSRASARRRPGARGGHFFGFGGFGDRGFAGGGGGGSGFSVAVGAGGVDGVDGAGDDEVDVDVDAAPGAWSPGPAPSVLPASSGILTSSSMFGTTTISMRRFFDRPRSFAFAVLGSNSA